MLVAVIQKGVHSNPFLATGLLSETNVHHICGESFPTVLLSKMSISIKWG